MIEPLSCTWALDHLAIDLPGVSSDLLDELRQAALAAGSRRLALVGGAVRDGLLHRQQHRAWTGVTDLDLVVEGDASAVASALKQRCGPNRLTRCLEHASFATVALTLDGLAVDLATARAETYPAPADNPVVRPGSLESDLVRRDFTINAMALDLLSGELIDRFDGRVHLAEHKLVFLHQGSGARLGSVSVMLESTDFKKSILGVNPRRRPARPPAGQHWENASAGLARSGGRNSVQGCYPVRKTTHAVRKAAKFHPPAS